jgi:hypothetical protein
MTVVLRFPKRVGGRGAPRSGARAAPFPGAAFPPVPAPQLGGAPPITGGIPQYPWDDGELLYAGALNAAIGRTWNVAADVAMLRLYGLLADGSGATLGSVYSTLAQAQQVYPFATSLDQTLDWAAIQQALNLPTFGGAVILLPPGDMMINSPLVSGAGPVYIRGDGPFTSRLILTGGTDLFQHGLAGPPVYGAAFELHDAGLYCNASGAGYAINIVQDTNTGVFKLTNVRIAPFSGIYAWQGYISAQGITFSMFRDLYCTGGEFNPPDQQADMTQIGITVYAGASGTTASYNLVFENCYIGAIATAVWLNMLGTSANLSDVEGVQFTNCGGLTAAGPWYKLSIPNEALWGPPWHVFTACNMQSAGPLITADRMGEFHMTDCLMVITEPQSGYTPGDYIQFTNGLDGGYIHDNCFSFTGDTVTPNVIYLGPYTANVTIRDNLLYMGAPPATLNAGVYNAAGEGFNVNIRCFDNLYWGWPAGTPMEVDATGGPVGNFFSQGTEALNYGNARGPTLSLRDAGAAIANSLWIQAGGTGYPPLLQAAGSDTDVSLLLQAQGTGAIMLGNLTPTSGPVNLRAAQCDATLVVEAPVTGFSITIPNNCSSLMLLPTATLASGTVTMPANPFPGQIVRIMSVETITALTIAANTGSLIFGGPSTIGSTMPVAFMYNAVTGANAWLRMS